MNASLQKLRQRIDTVDSQILLLLKKRLAIVSKVHAVKQKLKLSPLDEKRKQEMLEKRLVQGKKIKLPEKLVKEYVELIHRYGVKLQEDLKP